ncbi:MAG: hypothetical protein HUU37_03825 [Bdellovibrionales bacterium]|nr:hypothetical protein [Bdellovibrionales bacterium]
MGKAIRAYLLMLCTALMAGCGYHMQGSKNPLHELGIRRIYVEGFRNLTYRPGIEQMFTTAMVRELEKGRAFRIVGSKSEADAVLRGVVQAADAGVSSTRSVQQGAKTLQVASEFSATISCDISLEEQDGRVIFNYVASGSKKYPSAAQTGNAGATVSLVNDSEQRIAYQFLAGQLMAGAYQRMIDIF